MFEKILFAPNKSMKNYSKKKKGIGTLRRNSEVLILNIWNSMFFKHNITISFIIFIEYTEFFFVNWHNTKIKQFVL